MIILKLNELNFPSVRKLCKLLHILLVRIQIPRRTFQILVKLAHISTVKSFGAWIWCLRNKIRSDFPSCPRCILLHTDHLALTCMTNDPCSISDAKIIWPDIYAFFFLSLSLSGNNQEMISLYGDMPLSQLHMLCLPGSTWSEEVDRWW
jgi:hypothetical protein